MAKRQLTLRQKIYIHKKHVNTCMISYCTFLGTQPLAGKDLIVTEHSIFPLLDYHFALFNNYDYNERLCGYLKSGCCQVVLVQN